MSLKYETSSGQVHGAPNRGLLLVTLLPSASAAPRASREQGSNSREDAPFEGGVRGRGGCVVAFGIDAKEERTHGGVEGRGVQIAVNEGIRFPLRD